jgi:hypothetical protein
MKGDTKRTEGVLPGGLLPEGERVEVGKGCGRMNVMQIYVHMYVNEKMILVETISGMG